MDGKEKGPMDDRSVPRPLQPGTGEKGKVRDAGDDASKYQGQLMTTDSTLTRREFAAITAGAVAAFAPGATLSAMQTTDSPSASQPAPTKRVESLETSLARPIPTQLRSLVAEQIRENDAAWIRGRKFPVPDG